MRIVIIIPYFGKKLPVYFSLYLKSIEDNKDIDFMFFTDIEIREKTPPNFLVKKISIIEFNELTYDATEINPRISNYLYKLCDLKPLYGVIFQEYILDYDYWGFGDIDLIYGDLQGYLYEKLEHKNVDIISLRKGWISGSTCLHKNTPKTNNLYKISKDWKKVLSDPNKYYGFDEISRTLDNKLLFKRIENGEDLNCIKTEVDSYTVIVKSNIEYLDISFEDAICEKINKGMLLKYDNGEITVLKKGRSNKLNQNVTFVAYHYVIEKKTIRFCFPTWVEVPNEFIISRYGFHKSMEEMFSDQFFRILKLFLFLYPLGFVLFLYRSLVNILTSLLPEKIHYFIGQIGNWLCKKRPTLYYRLKRLKHDG
jgi:hypothetical protein